jgi:hypothetical protein
MCEGMHSIQQTQNKPFGDRFPTFRRDIVPSSSKVNTLKNNAFFVDLLTLEVKGTTFLRNVGIPHLTTHRHIPEDKNSHKHRCDNLK